MTTNAQSFQAQVHHPQGTRFGFENSAMPCSSNQPRTVCPIRGQTDCNILMQMKRIMMNGNLRHDYFQCSDNNFRFPARERETVQILKHDPSALHAMEHPTTVNIQPNPDMDRMVDCLIRAMSLPLVYAPYPNSALWGCVSMVLISWRLFSRTGIMVKSRPYRRFCGSPPPSPNSHKPQATRCDNPRLADIVCCPMCHRQPRKPKGVARLFLMGRFYSRYHMQALPVNGGISTHPLWVPM